MDEYREEIALVTAEMMALFEKRMELSRKIGEYKKARHLPVIDEEREALLLEKYTLKNYPEQSAVFLKTLFALSKTVQ